MNDLLVKIKRIQKALENAEREITEVLSEQPEQSSEIQDILEYLDTALHPIISPDHWNVYSELHDMISMLPSAQPEHTETHSCDYQRTETHGWIPVTERLPEDGVMVWVTIKGHDIIRCEDGETLEQAVARISKMRRVSEGFWGEDDKTWYNAGGYPMMVQPVAWMPMEVPEPYKERQEE